MISNFEAILDEVFGSVELPTLERLVGLAQSCEDYPHETLAMVIQYMWLDRNDPEAFDEAIMNEL